MIEFGGPEALQVVDLPEVHAAPGEVRIRVHAAAVNPTDTFVRNGARAEALQKYPPPYIPGMDAAGVIDSKRAATGSDGPVAAGHGFVKSRPKDATISSRHRQQCDPLRHHRSAVPDFRRGALPGLKPLVAKGAVG